MVVVQKTYNIPNNRILVGEFGGHRKAPGLDKYFQDLITIFTQEKWNFAFYAFRKDNYIGMDYELGDKNLPASYWDAVERGQKSLSSSAPTTWHLKLFWNRCMKNNLAKGVFYLTQELEVIKQF